MSFTLNIGKRLPAMLVGLIFLISAILKLFSVFAFEASLYEISFFPWQLVPFLSRLIICAELFLGAMLILRIYPLVFHKISIFLLLSFTLYLALDLIINGVSENCGCMGEVVPISNLMSLIKNLVLALLLFASKHFYIQSKSLSKLWVPLVFIILISSSVFLSFPIPAKFSNSIEINEKVDYTNMLQEEVLEDEMLIAFLSLECRHCKVAASKLQILNEQLDLPKIHVLFFGEENIEAVRSFVHQTNMSLSYSFSNHPNYLNTVKGQLPTLHYLEKNVLKKSWVGSAYLKSDFEKLGTKK